MQILSILKLLQPRLRAQKLNANPNKGIYCNEELNTVNSG